MGIVPLKNLVDEAKVAFVKEFGGEHPTICASAPGRVNIIGEHTDYNDGLVMPMAIPMWTVIVGRPNGKKTIGLVTLASGLDEPKLEFDAPTKDARLSPGTPKWANYVKGVVEHFPAPIPGFDACIITSVPLGGGLSSSASLEVATCTFLEVLTKQQLPPREKALLCQKAEHTFAAMPCGIMDQFICAMAQDNSALLIDCKSLDSRIIPLPRSEELCFLVVDSNVKHQLGNSEYPQRREDCMQAAKVLGVESLRAASLSSLREKREILGDRVYQRALHVVSEIERCEKASVAMIDGDLEYLGRLMYQSHVSLRDLFQVSCPELDQLVDITMRTKGVLGSRMTGGGFGGCVVALIKNSEAATIIEAIDEHYKKSATCYVVNAVAGTADISLAA